MTAGSPGPLTGVRVLDLTMWVQGPVAGTLLADLGADVVKVEKAGVGDFARAGGTLYGVKNGPPGLLWKLCNRNKRALALDLSDERAIPIWQALVKSADVLVTNLLPSALKQFGADEDAVRELNPTIVYARSAGYGELGPLATEPCQDTVGMAYGGFMWTASADRERPYYPPGAMSDVLSGTMTAFGVLGALLERQRTGNGQYVGSSQLQTMMWMQSVNIGAAANLGEPFEVADRESPANPTFNTYPCGDGRWIALGMPSPNFWEPLCRAMGLERLLSDPRFADFDSRRQNSTECVKLFDATFATASSTEWIERLRAANLWVAPINRVEDLLDDDQVRANGYLMELDDGDTAVRMPFSLRGHEPGRRPSPEHGSDTDALLAELGVSSEDRDRLRADGVAW